MRRTWFVAGVVAAFVLTLALPAQAKGEIGNVTISPTGSGGAPGGGVPGGGSGGSGKAGGSGGGGGAALAVPITLEADQAGAWLEGSGFFEYKSVRPDVKLGAGFDAMTTVDCGRSISLIRQRLYPYASGGPVAFMLPGQAACDGPLDSGWTPVTGDLMSILVAEGLPPALRAPAFWGAAATDAGAGAGAAASSDDAAGVAAGPGAQPAAFPMLPLIAGVAALLAMLSGAAVVHRRRSTIVA